MSRTTVQVAYDGAAVAGGAMDARELAPALLAISDAFRDAARVLNGGDAKARVLVKSEFKDGSFEISLELIQSLAQEAKALFELQRPFTAGQVAEIIGLTAGSTLSLLKFIKWLRGRKVKSVTKIKNGQFSVETEADFDTIEISEETIKLYRDKELRKSVVQVLAPLLREGIDKFIVRGKKKKVIEVAKSEVTNFDLPALPDEELTEQTRRAAYNVVGVFFDENLKWRLFDGETRINAAILDHHFLDALDRGEVSFTKGDILEVDIRTRQYRTDKGLRTEHEVLRVIRQHKAHQQIPLPFAEDED